jgi:hypothetical protein
MSQLKTSAKQEKKQSGLSRLSRFDAAALVANTAVEVREGGHNIVVKHARVQGEQGILIFIPGFELVDGDLRLVANDAPVAEVVANPVAV